MSEKARLIFAIINLVVSLAGLGVLLYALLTIPKH